MWTDFQFRSWFEFCSIHAMWWPVSAQIVVERVGHNVVYFSANYCLILVAFLILAAVMRPRFGVALVLTATLVHYVVVLQSNVITIGTLVIDNPDLVTMIVFTICMLLLAGTMGASSVCLVIMGLLVVLVHASMKEFHPTGTMMLIKSILRPSTAAPAQ